MTCRSLIRVTGDFISLLAEIANVETISVVPGMLHVRWMEETCETEPKREALQMPA